MRKRETEIKETNRVIKRESFRKREIDIYIRQREREMFIIDQLSDDSTIHNFITTASL